MMTPIYVYTDPDMPCYVQDDQRYHIRPIVMISAHIMKDAQP